jgi:hypothetical protein
VSEPARTGASPRQLLLALFALFALGNVLVLVFLGKTGLAVLSAAVACGFLILLWLGERRIEPQEPVRWRTLAICLAVACVLLVLGGEGRLLYANEDWQVRDAVLADMARNPWPFAYPGDGGGQMLRAPLGMYLLPALVGQGGQVAADLALLACNTLMLGLLLALASTLFPSARARRIALIVFAAFSGLDIVGTLIASASDPVSFDHLERWAPPLQYSSMLTLLFWVPQHAIAGWFCALLYLLHRRGSITLGSLAASVALAAIWSPLAIIGAVPLVAWAGLRVLHARDLRWSDVATGAVALALALPALAYLAADAQQLPSGVRGLGWLSLPMFLLLEVAPFLWVLYRLRAPHGFGTDTLVLVAAMLALIPFFHLGGGADLVMRASIAPLAVLAAMLVASLVSADWGTHRRFAPVVVALLALGAVTGTAEIARALRFAPAPPPQCTLPEIWPRQTGWVADTSTYLAAEDALPAPLRPQSPTLVRPAGGECWSRPWKDALHG